MTSNEVLSPNVLNTVIAKALADPAFKARLLANADAALAALGVELPAGVSLRFVEDTATTKHVVIPAPGRRGELADELLAEVAGGLAGGMIGIKKPKV